MDTERHFVVLMDGPNIYKSLPEQGLERGKLDYQRLAEAVSGGQKPLSVVFFTSRIDKNTQPDKHATQNAFLQHLERAGMTLRIGRLVMRWGACPSCGHVEENYVEKGLDVQIAMSIVEHASMPGCAGIWLLSADSDFAPAVEYAVRRGVPVHIAMPAGRRAPELERVATSRCEITQDMLDKCQVRKRRG